MNLKLALIAFALSAITLGCGSQNNDKKRDAKPPVAGNLETKYTDDSEGEYTEVSSDGTYEYSFRGTSNNCATGAIKSSSKTEFCEKLQDNELNKNCALHMRTAAFSRVCPGEFHERQAPAETKDVRMKCTGTAYGQGITKKIDQEVSWDGLSSQKFVLLPFEDIHTNPNGEVSVTFIKGKTFETSEVRIVGYFIDNHKTIQNATQIGGGLHFVHRDPKYQNRKIDVDCKTIAGPKINITAPSNEGYKIVCMGGTRNSEKDVKSTLYLKTTWDGKTEQVKNVEVYDQTARFGDLKVKLVPAGENQGPQVQILAQSVDGHIYNSTTSTGSFESGLSYVNAWDHRFIDFGCNLESQWSKGLGQ